MFLTFLLGGALALSQTKFSIPDSWEKVKIPLRPAFWKLEYDSYGKITFKNQELIFSPKPPIANETLSVLLLSTITLPEDNFYIKVTYEVLDQLRPVPNPWETLWLFWAYEKQGSEKDTAYVILKKNNVELGHAFNHAGQNFLFTQALNIQPSSIQTLEVLRTGTRLAVRTGSGNWVEIPEDKVKLLPKRKSPFGLYCEDSRIRILTVETRFP